ncbi:hypothetical protein [Microtetraspora fusca]|uniref:hypothetical protein n=1 Tax=Microtetraspora fusca TaxID=1997 RepID=UPI000AE8F1C0|nr:hypothetical protein [Microtetraspora fusca]
MRGRVCRLALGALRFWERGAWQRGHGVTAADVEAIIGAVPEALKGRCLTREELVEAVIEVSGVAHLRQALTSGWGALLKPLSFLGELCYGPPRDLEALLPAAVRPKVSRAAGWISPVVVHRGRVAGVWEAKDGRLAVELAEPVPQAPLQAAAERIAALLGRPAELVIE